MMTNIDFENAEAKHIIKSPEFYELVKKYGFSGLSSYYPCMAMFEMMKKHFGELGIIGTLDWENMDRDKHTRRKLIDLGVKEYEKGRRNPSKDFIKEWVLLEYGPYNTEAHGNNLTALERWEDYGLEGQNES
ncbi:MAG: hypothetical protein V3U54_08450 [Thermodesulfobacteriota bacterium]